jgi:hypothetical protein
MPLMTRSLLRVFYGSWQELRTSNWMISLRARDLIPTNPIGGLPWQSRPVQAILGALGSASGSVNNFVAERPAKDNRPIASAILFESKILCGITDEIH